MKPLQQSLFAPAPVVKPAPSVRRRAPRVAPLQRRVPLWLAVYLPRLPLDALLRGQETSTAQAVIESGAGVPRIHAIDAQAADAGIRIGMTLAAAWAKLPQLAVHERNENSEQQMLARLAAWAHAFTPTVCCDRQAVLLEVRGSLNLFAGAAGLQERVRNGMRAFGFEITTAMAPAPRAALWLARAGSEVRIEQLDALAGIIGDLPLDATGFDAELLERFNGIGARRVRDVLRLPRDGFARRYSARILRELDQALGRAPDVRRSLPLPKKFSARVELLYEIQDAERLLHPVQQLLQELDGYLQATQQGVSRLQLRLQHRDKSFTEVGIGFAEVTRDVKRLRDLTEQKFENLVLPSPVLSVELCAQEMDSLAGRDRTLFVEQNDDDDWPQLVERLRVRLGNDAVCSVEQQFDHRPERAWRFVAPGTASETPGLRGRPQWLLEQPQALRVRKEIPCCGEAPVEILQGPERIETGWWDEADVARDYYMARDKHGRRLWICQEVKSGRWWLQGIFS